MPINYSFGLPLKHNFVEYVYYNNIFSSQEINNIRNFWKDDETVKAPVSGDVEYKEDLRKSSVMFIEDTPDRQWLFHKLASLAIQCNSQRFWFDILGFHEELQLARYTEGDFFDWHLDFGPGEPSMRKLSLSLQLSDPNEYEGGDLQFMINQNIVSAPREKGTLIIFPSFILHRVTPITKGHRQSIVGWVSGPPYR